MGRILSVLCINVRERGVLASPNYCPCWRSILSQRGVSSRPGGVCFRRKASRLLAAGRRTEEIASPYRQQSLVLSQLWVLSWWLRAEEWCCTLMVFTE